MIKFWKYFLAVSLTVAVVLGGFVYFKYKNKKTDIDIAVALSTHIFQVNLLREDASFYYFRVEKVWKGSTNFVGKEIKQKKIFYNGIALKPRHLISILNINEHNEVELTFSQNYFFRIPIDFYLFGFKKNWYSLTLSEAIENQNKNFYKKPTLADVDWYEAIFRGYKQANEILLIKILEERKNVKANVFRVKVAVERVLKGDRGLINKEIYLTYYYDDFPEKTYMVKHSTDHFFGDDISYGETINSGTTKKEFRCNSLKYLEKNHRYIIQVGLDSIWEDSENLKLEKKFPQFSSFVECEVVEDSSPFFRLVLDSF